MATMLTAECEGAEELGGMSWSAAGQSTSSAGGDSLRCGVLDAPSAVAALATAGLEEKGDVLCDGECIWAMLGEKVRAMGIDAAARRAGCCCCCGYE
jgi:hypothetical protein